jgi:transposase
MTTSLKDLRALMERERTPGGQLRGSGRRAAVDAIERLHAAGASYREIADGVGVKFQTLMSWRFTAERSTALVPVRVSSPAPAARALVVHGPRGLRIEGLSLDELATLWSRLSS